MSLHQEAEAAVRELSEFARMARTSGDTDGYNEQMGYASLISRLAAALPVWRKDVAAAPKHAEILALSPESFDVDGPRPVLLRWFFYNGLSAWRDRDGDAHSPTHWILPPPTTEQT